MSKYYPTRGKTEELPATSSKHGDNAYKLVELFCFLFCTGQQVGKPLLYV